MSYSSLFQGKQLVLPSLLQSSYSLIACGEVASTLANPGVATVALPGILATDICLASNGGSATPGNLLFPVAGVATVDTLTFTVGGNVAGNPVNCTYLVFRAL